MIKVLKEVCNMDNSIHAIGFKQTLLSIFIATALTACGGSGGSSSHASAPEKSGAIRVQVIDGYLNGAEVFADLNRDYEKQDNEPSATTNENGVAFLEIPSSELTDIGSIKIISVSKKGDANTVLGEQETLAQDIVMSSTIYLESGKAKTENFVTPFTTLTDLSFSKEESDNLSRDKYLDRLKEIASSIGVEPDVVDSDYNNANTKENVAALVAGELIVRTNLLPIDLKSSKSVSELETYTKRTVTDSLSLYKDVVSDIADNTDLSSPAIAENLNAYEAKLGSSFRVLTSGAADEWRCGVTKTNNVYCWGNNSWGNLGDPEIYPGYAEGNPVKDGVAVKGNFSAKPVAVKIKQGDSYVPLSGVKSVALGNVHACAVTYVGEVYCWGGNYHGQLGNVPNEQEMTEDKVKSYHAVKVLRGQQEGSSEYLSNIDYLQLGQNHSCALSNDGEVYCWGDNSSYELGGRYEGFEHQSYDSYDKEIYNYSGQIKLNDWIKNVHVPVKLKFPESVAKVKFLSSGLWSHCAIVENVDTTDGHNLYCWGSDRAGTITHNYKQYKEHFKKNYEGKFVKDLGGDKVYNIDDYWNWFMYDQSGDWYPLYGAPITLINSYYRETTYKKIIHSLDELKKFKDYCFDKIDCRIVSNPELLEAGYVDYSKYTSGGDGSSDEGSSSDEIFRKYFDDISLYEKFLEEYNKSGSRVRIHFNKAPIVALMYNEKNENDVLDLVNVKTVALSNFDGNVQFVTEDDPSVHGTWYGSYWKWYGGFDFEVSKVYANVEDKPTCVLTTDEKVYCFGNNIYGLLGQGKDKCQDQDPDQAQCLDEGHGYVKDSDGVFPLENVKELSLVKRSYCASVADQKKADGSVDEKQLSLYCWGSSAFGQMGFDNGIDHDWSYGDASFYWKQGSDVNQFFDNSNRIVYTPRIIKEIFENQ